MQSLREGIAFAKNPFEGTFDEEGNHGKHEGLDPIPFDADAWLVCGDSRTDVPAGLASDIVVTDPPYADNVNYSELADFFYVWLRLVLKDEVSEFAPEYCPKSAEIVENRRRGLSMEDFETGLREVLQASAARVSDDGLVIFTFHHAEGSSWESVLNAVCKAGTVHVPVRRKLVLGAENKLYAYQSTGKRIPLWRLFGANPVIRDVNGHVAYAFGENLS